MTEEKIVYLMRGLASCGKSTTSKKLAGDAGVIFETDEYFYAQVGDDPTKYDYRRDLRKTARLWNFERFKKAVDDGISPIVVDRGNSLSLRTQEYARYAVDAGYRVELAEPESPWWQEIRVLLKYKQLNKPVLDAWAQELENRSLGTHRVPASQIRERMEHWKWDLTVEDILKYRPQQVTLLNRRTLEQSLERGTRFLLNQQSPAGSFTYEYDWKTKSVKPGDSVMGQAAVVWALSLINEYQPSENVAAAIERALEFFQQHSKIDDAGARYAVYPGKNIGSTRAVALLALAHIDYLRSMGSTLPAVRATSLRDRLDSYLQTLLKLRRDDGLFHSRYRHADGSPCQPPSVTSDGAALLALAKASRYSGWEELKHAVSRLAQAGYKNYIRRALDERRQSDQAGRYYGWSAEVLHELSYSGWPKASRSGDLLLEMSNRMIDINNLLATPSSSNSIYVGLLHAYKLAVDRDEETAVHRCAKAIDKGLARLTALQIGGPLPDQCPKLTGDVEVDGGILSGRDDSVLRIDTTAQQMQAVILALKYVYVR